MICEWIRAVDDFGFGVRDFSSTDFFFCTKIFLVAGGLSVLNGKIDFHRRWRVFFRYPSAKIYFHKWLNPACKILSFHRPLIAGGWASHKQKYEMTARNKLFW